MKVLMIGPANLGPYHFARFRAITKLLPEITYVRVFFKEQYRPWHSDLGAAPCRIVSLKQVANVTQFLDEESPDIVIVIGYTKYVYWKVVRWAKKHSVPSILQCDSQHKDHPRHWWKELVKSVIVRYSFDAAFVAGERSAMYVRSLGIPENAIWYGVDVVDNEHFAVSNQKWRASDNFPRNYFLTVTRLSPEKNLIRLLQSFERYRQNGGDWGLVIAGTGPIERELKESIPTSLVDFVYWYGWASYDELPSFYHGASCFILPSTSEPWGLVVNEAMSAGLPVLVSLNCGCSPELCKTGINGYSFDPFDVEQLAELMFKMSSKEVDLDSMGRASKEIIKNYTPEIWAKTVMKMAETLIERGK